jgi:2-C-methyl-D-erythritol 4-phosphate cytidylyltransferase
VHEVWVIIVGAGSGSRFGGPKQYEPLGDGTVLSQSVRGARSVADGVVIVVPNDRVEADAAGFPDAIVVAGGATRSASVRAGLAAVPDRADRILVHDAARPLASERLYRDVVAALDAGTAAVVPVVPVSDTICDAEGNPVDRSQLRAVQTPQAFAAAALRSAHTDRPEATDDVSLVRSAGGKVKVVDGLARNRKITDADDLVAARAMFDA